MGVRSLELDEDFTFDPNFGYRTVPDMKDYCTPRSVHPADSVFRIPLTRYFKEGQYRVQTRDDSFLLELDWSDQLRVAWRPKLRSLAWRMTGTLPPTTPPPPYRWRHRRPILPLLWPNGVSGHLGQVVLRPKSARRQVLADEVANGAV